MHLVPVLAGGNGHIGNCKIFIQLIEGCGTSPSSGGYHRGAYLHTLVEAGAVEKAVQKGNQSTIGRCIINGRADDDPVAFLKFWSSLIYQVVKDTFSGGMTFSAADAATYILMTHMNQFCFNTLCFESRGHFR